MTRPLLSLAAACLLLAAFALPSHAQEPATLTYGTIAHLHSTVLGEDRRLNIFLPPEYADSTTRFPVLYLLDGSAHEDYLHVVGLVDFLATYGVMPPTIVVGISNVDRRRDFTRPSENADDRKAAPTSGGADTFVAFLATELEPYVDAHYRTTSTRTLIGQSLGGLVATQILLEKPELFTQYIIVSPSLWWNKQALMRSAPTLIQAHSVAGRAVYLAVGDEGNEMRIADAKLDSLLQNAGGPSLRHKLDLLDNETHATLLHISVYNALRFLYARKP